MGYNKQRHV